MTIIKRLLTEITLLQQNKAIIIAFDGVDTSGKTTFANTIHKELKNIGKNSIRISIDKFHNPRKIRMKQGLLSPESYYYDSFNINEIMKCVLEPVKNNKGIVIHGIYDYKKESNVEIVQTKITNDLIVLFDGIFMNRDEFREYWDLSIFLDISFETVLKRAIRRDIEYFGSVEEVKKRYINQYIPGEKLYFKKCNPKNRASIVIDNNDYNKKTIIKWI